MDVSSYAWLIPLLPTLAFVISLIRGYKLGKKVSAYLGVVLMLVSTVLASILLAQVLQAAPSWDKAKLYEISKTEKEIAHLQKAELTDVSSTRIAEIKVKLEQAEHYLHTLEEEAQVRRGAHDFPFTSYHPWLVVIGEEGFPLGLFY